jgi:hypothetical protein
MAREVFMPTKTKPMPKKKAMKKSPTRRKAA